MNKRNFYIIVVSILLVACGKKFDETTPSFQDITKTVFATGTIESHRSYELRCELEGYIDYINVEVNDKVESRSTFGIVANLSNDSRLRNSRFLFEETLRKLNEGSPELQELLLAYEEANTQFKLDSAEMISYQSLYDLGMISKLELNNERSHLEQSRKNMAVALQNYRKKNFEIKEELSKRNNDLQVLEADYKGGSIEFPQSGIVLRKYVSDGDYVNRGDLLAMIGGEADFYVALNIDESSISKLRIGQRVSFQFNTLEDSIFYGHVQRIYPVFDSENQSYSVEISIEDQNIDVFLGTQLQANIYTEKISQAILIPRKFLNYDGSVQVKGEDERRKVEVSFYGTEWVHILSGLKGDEVLVAERKN